MRGGAHGGRRGQLQATEPNRAWNEPQSAQLRFSWLETQSIRLVPMAGANSERVTEQRGKAHPCHASVAHTRNRFEQFAGSFYGRYWARTSDPQLVDLVQPFASVRWRSLRQHR